MLGACWGSVLATGPARYPEHFPAPQRRRPAQAPPRAPLGGTDQAGYRMRWWHRSSGFRPLLWTELGTAPAPTHVHTCARDHGATPTPGNPRRGPVPASRSPSVSPPAVTPAAASAQHDSGLGRLGRGQCLVPTAGPAGSRSAPWCASSLGAAAPHPPQWGCALRWTWRWVRCFPCAVGPGARPPIPFNSQDVATRPGTPCCFSC